MVFLFLWPPSVTTLYTSPFAPGQVLHTLSTEPQMATESCSVAMNSAPPLRSNLFHLGHGDGQADQAWDKGEVCQCLLMSGN